MLKKLIKFLQENVFFTLIVLFTILIRFIFPEVPPALNWDEVSHGYNAFSILLSAKDEWGEFLPIIFRAYGDYKLPVYIYLVTISEFFFGLTAFAVRLPSVVAGIGTVVFTYLLTRELFSGLKDHKPLKYFYLVPAFALFLTSIEPWSFFLSRAAFEANLALFFFVAGIYFFFKGIHSQHITSNLLTSTVFLGLTVWTYNSYRIFTPLMIIVLIAVYRKELVVIFKNNKKLSFYSIILMLTFLLPMFFQLLTSVGQARYSWVEIVDEGMVAKINEARGLGGSRWVHNKIVYFLSGFSRNYVSHLHPNFLFINGGANYQFSYPGAGILHFVNLPFLYLGLVFFLWNLVTKFGKNFDRQKLLVMFFWILIAPVPSSLTREAPHVLRAITFLPIPMILASFGIFTLSSFLAKNSRNVKIFIGLYTLILLGQSACYFKAYFTKYGQRYSQAWQYGYKEVAGYIAENYSYYDKIIVTKKYGEPHEFLLFYLKWKPINYTSDKNLIRFYQTNWYWVDSFDKFYFVNDWEISEKSEFEISRAQNDNFKFKLESGDLVNCSDNSKCLVITSPGNIPQDWNKIGNIEFLDGKMAFEMYSN